MDVGTPIERRPPPSVEFAPTITGFTWIDRSTSDDEVEWLREPPPNRNDGFR